MFLLQEPNMYYINSNSISTQRANSIEFTQSRLTHSHTVGGCGWIQGRCVLLGQITPALSVTDVGGGWRQHLLRESVFHYHQTKLPDLRCARRSKCRKLGLRGHLGQPLSPSHTRFSCHPCSSKGSVSHVPTWGAPCQGPRAAGPAYALKTGRERNCFSIGEYGLRLCDSNEELTQIQRILSVSNNTTYMDSWRMHV